VANWRYEGLDRAGGSSTGTVAAPDRGTAMRLVQARGLTPLRLESDETADPASPATAAMRFKPWAATGPGRPSIGRAELASLVRELATAVEAGLPLMQALRTVRRQAAGKSQPVILDALIEKVEAGRPLHEAMQAYGAPFDDMVVGMARAADASGRMPEVLHQLADLLDRSVELRRELI
jgi:type II secretory pathway component PulF